MTVSLTIGETIDPVSTVADSLGGGGTGLDHGSVTNGSYTNVVSQPSNTGTATLFIIHDAVVDPITDVKTFIDTYSQAYGGPGTSSAAADYSTLKGLGDASGSSKNNGDGLSGGLWITMDFDISTTNQFDIGTFPTLVKIYGDSGETDGVDAASAFTMKAEAMVFDSGGESAPSVPVDGSIGKSGDTVLGDNAKALLRLYLPTSHAAGGIFQWDWTVSFTFTA